MKRLKILQNTKPQWRSIEDRKGQNDDRLAELESPMGAREWETTEGLSRRGFMGVAGGTLAASTALLAGCIRKPTEYIVPLSERPEDRVPGAPLYYNTVARIGGSVMGLRVTSMDGRPIKVDGNPSHPSTLGGANTFAQASIMELYDGDRARTPSKGGAEATWDDFTAWADAHFAGKRGNGAGMALLVEENCSPTTAGLIDAFVATYPGARVFVHDMSRPDGAIAGASLVGLAGWRTWSDLSAARVIASFDNDFLGTDGDVVRNTKGYARSRKLDAMSRLYVVEPSFTNTGANADNRLRLKASAVGGFVAAVAKKVFASGVSAPAGASGAVAALKADAAGQDAWVDALAKDLVAHRGASVVLVGAGQPGWVHGVANLLNAALGNVGKTTSWVPSHASTDAAPGIDELAAAIKGRSVNTLVVLGGNPALTAPADLGFGELLASVENSVHLSRMANETSAKSTWTLPASHFLESWGDATSFDGTYTIQQPLVAPLFGSWSADELLARLTDGKAHTGYDLVRETARGLADGDFETTWRRWLHDGVGKRGDAPTVPVAAGAAAPVPTDDAAEPTEADAASPDEAVAVAPPPRVASWSWTALGAAAGQAKGANGDLEVVFQLDPKLFDGRYANLAWLQELPEPVSKLSWDNALLVAPATASKLSLGRGDMVTLTMDGRSVDVGVFVLPGVADDTLVFSLGHGRGEAGGRFAKADYNNYTVPAGGFNAYAVKGAGWFGPATLEKTGATYDFVTTQEHGRLDPKVETPFGTVEYERRPHVMEATLADYTTNPKFAQVEPLFPLESLFTSPNETGGQQWGMTIDLNACTGCNACTVACQAENNIQVAGKDRVANGREMHWIRLDRYFTGEDENNPEAVFQPINCMHCETAPCETVCPVGATSHSPDGLNDMAYNRCIGTRYCANNCPFKVRRFNFFNFSREAHEANDLLLMQQNPNVTVRFRGVIEKCTYCTQRVSAAKIQAKVNRKDGRVQDGAIVPACAETCPADAITFGDINDATTAVSKLKADPRNYALLQDLNIHPRTTFLAKIRNPNPELA
jgi:Fe-S-cluster-containing dehydrogenase component/anaerobic selenocysteine-containing dehydrogenase